ncbi:MAG: ABC transporter permease subunit [Wenzhouxiangella sp.]|nr:ABC transporter permease subunit [Wenzhouxiangella sp.]MDR9453005.1 ABC transporter permease subunit [Wenzhouxiangella sp.]
MNTKLGMLVAKEFSAYFQTPIATFFLVIFSVLSVSLTFFLGDFFEREIADLRPFFQFHPWIYLFLVPAVGMRLWAEEYRSGSAELLLTLPVTTGQVVLGKFLAGWVFLGLALLMTVPLWISVNVLGDPDNGVIVAGYMGSWLVSGAFLAISAAVSATTQNQVIAFIVSALICFVLLMAGWPLVLEPLASIAPQWLIDSISRLSVLVHYAAMARGVLDVRDLVYFFGLMVTALAMNWVVIEMKKAA